MKSIQRSLILLFIGIFHLLAFGAAGVLSSHFTTVNNEVLLAPSQSCGVVSVSFPLLSYHDHHFLSFRNVKF